MIPGAVKQVDAAVGELVRQEKLVVVHGDRLAAMDDWQNEALIWGRMGK